MNEQIETIYENMAIRIEKIISHGATTPFAVIYDQEEWEWVWVTRGDATLRFEHQTFELTKGQSLVIPPHVKHSVVYTSDDCEWQCVYLKQPSNKND